MSCAIGVGAPRHRLDPLAVFGKATASRMFGSSARSATKRSSPIANPPCGGAPIAQRVEQEAEASSACCSLDADRREDALLELGLVDPERARAELHAVPDEVVGLAAPRPGSVSIRSSSLGRSP